MEKIKVVKIIKPTAFVHNKNRGKNKGIEERRN